MSIAAIFVLLIVAVSADDIFSRCDRVFDPYLGGLGMQGNRGLIIIPVNNFVSKASKKCCTGIAPPDLDRGPKDDLMECYKLPINQMSCERDECFAIKQGYYSSSGDIDEKGIISVLEKLLEKNPELLAPVIDTCVKGDITKFGPPEMCKLTKVRHCVQIELLSNCSGWNNAGECAGLSELVKECASKIQ